MRVMSLCLAIGLVFAICTDALAQPRDESKLEVRSMHESWSGLAGKLCIDGKEFTLRSKSGLNGGLIVRGFNGKVVRTEVEVMLESGENVPEIYEGMYLSYADSLSLSKERGPNTMWRMVNFSRTYIDKKRQGRRSLYVDTKTESFELEAISRPGFFLIVDAQGFLTLKDKRGHTIKFTKETVWDDINDGK